MRPSLRLASLVFATPLACTVYEVPDDSTGTGTGGSTDAATTASATSSGATSSTGGWEPTTTSSTSGGTTTGVDPSAGPTSASDPTSASSDGTTGDPPPAQCDFPTSIQPIFSASCGCHGGDMPPKGLVLAAGLAFDSLVGVDSMEQPGTPRVDPFNPAGSWLVTKLKPAPPAGEQMPPGGMVAPNDLALIETWIAAGAPEAGAFDCAGGMGGDAGSVTIDEAGPVQVEIGEMLDLDVTVLDEQGQPVMGATVKWTSSDEATLYVDGKGTLLGVGPGQSQVTAEVDGVVSDPLAVEVLVSDPPVAPFVDVLNTLTTNCGCHKGDMPPAALRFDLAPDLVHASLLAPATQDPNSKRVVKDAPGQSYLFRKLTRTVQATGEQMPKGKPPLEAEKVQIILRWITGGAPL